MTKQRPSDPAIVKMRSQWGLITRIAEVTGLSRQAVSRWKRVRPEYVEIVAPILKMTPHQIRPDVFRKKKRRG